MKRKLKRIISVFLTLCMIFTINGVLLVSAEENTISLEVVQSGAEQIIKGKIAGAGKDAMLILKIYEKGIVDFDAEDIPAKGLAMLISTKDTDGSFEEAIDLGAFYSTGYYTAEVSYGSENQTCDFYHVNRYESAVLIEGINDAQNLDGVKGVLESNNNYLKLGMIEYAKDANMSSLVNDYTFSNKTYSDLDALLEQYQIALCVYDLKFTDSPLELIFKEHTSANMKYKAITDAIDDQNENEATVIAKLRERLKSADFASSSIKDVIINELLVARVLSAERYTLLENMLKAEILSGEHELGKYNEVESKGTVFNKMFTNKPEITSYEKLWEVFKTAANAAYDDENSGGTDGGTDGGNSGSGSSSDGKKTDVIDVLDENINKDHLKPTESIFEDVKGHWASDYINVMLAEKIATGYPDGSFKPDGFVTRAEFVKFVTEAFRISLKETEASFNDVSENDWFYAYVRIAVSNDLVQGADGAFRPNDRLTRQDAAVILNRLINESAEGQEISFKDKGDISDYAVGAVEKLSAMGIINGVNSSFLPKNNITRAEVAAMIVRLKEM